MTDAVRLAVGTLTRFPTAAPRRLDRTTAGRAMLLAPLTAVPLVVVLIVAHLAVAAGGLPAYLAAVLVLAATAWWSRGLHLDGLADTADGLGVRGDLQRRLDVMRDPANGTFATLALGLWGLLWFAIVASLDTGQAMRTLIAAAACGRWMAVVHGALLGPARPDGLGSAFVPTRVALATTTGCAVVVSLVVLRPGPGAAAFGAALLAGLAFTAFARRAFGGQTGDTLGACVVVAETAAALAALAVLTS
jgi:adenosylcobinamide-GDP ribazoletransferase